jgi:alkanesulfonate monooxygenase SsuD/methylene tetrahydromethanopterin reductase-like flavin-dependent oxidoreductase (luciferase family)
MGSALDNLGVAMWTLQTSPLRPGNRARLYAEMVEDVELVEAHGFASVWSAEHHFWHDDWCPALLHAQAQAVARTSRVRFGQAMLLAPLHDPRTLARSALTLDRLSGGRLDLGVALGHRDAEFDGFGLRRDRRGRLMEGALAVFAEEWSGVGGEGSTGQPGGPPIWVGGMAPKALARAACGGHGLMLPPTLSPGKIEALLEPYFEALPADLERRPRIGMLRDVHIAADEAQRRRFLAGLRDHYTEEIGAWWVVGGEVGFVNPENVRAQVDYNERGALAGPPETVAAGLGELFDAGVTHLAARLNFDFLDRAAVHRQVELLATEVAPRLDRVAA